jgi:hypothetical protein
VKRNGRVAKIGFGVGAAGVVSHAGGRLLVETAARIGLASGLRDRLVGWRPTAVHDPGTVLLHAALSLAVGGRRPVDMAVLRAAPGVFGPVASPATVSRTVAALVAGDGGAAAEAAIWQALADARAVAWELGGAPARDAMITVDLDASLVTVYSAKQGAANTFKKTFGLHPLFGFIDHGPGGTGEPAAGLLRPGNAGSNTAVDHITVLERVLAGLPEAWTRRDGEGRSGRRPILVRIDGAGATHKLLDYIHEQGMQFSVRFTLAGPDVIELATALPADAWAPARNDPAGVAHVAEATDAGWVQGWPDNSRLIVRREHPSRAARHLSKYRQMSICEVDGMRYTAILTNRPDLPADVLELDHRRHARVEDRIKDGKDTGLDHLPYPDLASNRIWLAVIACAQLLLAHTARLALTGPWRTASPKTLRLRLFACAGRLVRTGRRTRLDYPHTWPWTTVIIDALTRLAALPDPG